jgi:hyperosmotically inducible periplasmic protein
MHITTIGALALAAILGTGCAMNPSGDKAGSPSSSSSSPSTASSTSSTAAAGSEDQQLASKVKAALAADADLAPVKIDVAATGSTVTLKGEIKSMVLRKKAQSITEGVSGVKAVDNRLIITG